jgi:predicted nucleic acid-binding Zn ribbon protein
VSRRAPRRLGEAVGALADDLAPRTPLAAVQRAWPEAVGELIAAEAHPAAERAGVVTVTCSSSVWAHELDLMSPVLIERLNGALEGPVITRLRCRASPVRGAP